MNRILWMVKDRILNEMKLRVESNIPREKITVSAIDPNLEHDTKTEEDITKVVTNKTIGRLVRDEFIEPTDDEGVYRITQVHYDHLKNYE